MCGLVGIASRKPQPDFSWLAIARDTLTHRGPDDAGMLVIADGRVGMAHRRLSIIDLSPAGHQPMNMERRGLSIIFNGEIYNFQELRHKLEERGNKFQSRSDTEVLLAAYSEWGTDCLSRLNGMFSFAIYDARSELLLLARDRAGEKPLFYRLEDDTLYFASELKALLVHPALPRRIDSEALDCYLAMGFVPGDRCILQGYNKLQAAHAMSFDLQQGTTKIWRYWQLPEIKKDEILAPHESDLLYEFENLLEDAVGRQLISDVPVGILLSGGIDSSLVTAMAIRHSSKVRTFTIGFTGHGKLDETPHAQLIAHHFGTEHTELVAKPTSADLLPTLARQFDEPIVDSSMFPTWLVSHLVRQHCSVALSGDGSDELFGGYNHYNRLLWMQQRLACIPKALRRRFAQTASQILPVGVTGRNYLQGMATNLDQSLPLIANYFDPATRKKLMRGHTDYQLVAESIHNMQTPNHTDLLQRATRMDFQNYLAEDILVKVDRSSMLNSLEVRTPFLDYRMIEFAFGKVPSHLKATINDRKVLLKRLAARVLPTEFDKRRKQGFAIPIAEWLKSGPFRDLFWDTLYSFDCLFDPVIVQGLLKGQDQGRNNGERLFALVEFELWRKAYAASL